MDPKQEEIIAEMSLYDDWLDKYDYLIGRGQSLAPLAEEHRTPRYLIEGCQSRVWLDAELRDGRIRFTADSDAIITRGIIALLIDVLDDRTPDEVLHTELYFIDRVGLRENLSPTRSNGLEAMLRQMRMYALAFRAKEEKAHDDQ